MMDSDSPPRLPLIKLDRISSFLQKHPLLTQKKLYEMTPFSKNTPPLIQKFHFEMFSQYFISHFVVREILYRTVYNS